MRGNITFKPSEAKPYIFRLPNNIKQKAKLISLNRGIELSEFVRESISEHIKKYKDIVDKMKVEKP